MSWTKNVTYRTLEIFCSRNFRLNFVLVVNSADIEKLMLDLKTKAKHRQESIQPYLIVQGPTIANIENVFIVVDTVRDRHKNAKTTLDICFKCFHSFHAKYHVQPEHIWTLIQNCL